MNPDKAVRDLSATLVLDVNNFLNGMKSPLFFKRQGKFCAQWLKVIETNIRYKKKRPKLDFVIQY